MGAEPAPARDIPAWRHEDTPSDGSILNRFF